MIKVFCANCTVKFAITEMLHNLRKVDGRNFFCPNGHPNMFSKKEIDLEEIINEKDKTIEDLHNQLIDQSAILEKLELDIEIRK